jgi:hypothetical protein
LTRTLGTTFPKIMTVTFNNFYINENTRGTSTWKREMIGTELICIQKHFTMNAMTWTSTEGIYTRNGERIREMTAGFATVHLLLMTYSLLMARLLPHPNGSNYTWLVKELH